jgi:hypothetical protein
VGSTYLSAICGPDGWHSFTTIGSTALCREPTSSLLSTPALDATLMRHQLEMLDIINNKDMLAHTGA